MLRTRTTWTRGRRGAVVGVSAAVVCLGGVLAACGGGGDGEGYVAVGSAGDTPRASGTAVAPTGDVSLVPLDEASASEGAARGSQAPQAPPDPGGGAGEPGAEPAPLPSASAGSGGANGAGRSTPRDEGGSGRTEESSPSPSASGGGGPAAGGPAKLAVSAPEREPTDKRWCEKVTADFHNTGGAAVRSGTVTFETHIIDALKIDWATIESTEKLPAPIAAGARKEKTWTVCVDEWRVPLGMHIETRDASVRWK